MNNNSVRTAIATIFTGLCLAASMSAHAASASEPTSLLGDRVSTDQALRTITITPSTRHVNVDKGEIVKFVSNGQEFAFNFDSADTQAFNLQRVAPSGALDHPVMVYQGEGESDPYVR